MLILSSPSGAGKTTLVKLLANKKNFLISVSHTTRKPRYNETEGVDYFFIDKKKFKEMVKNDEFLEHALVFNNYYGTTKNNVFKNLENDKNVIFDIDWQGTKQILSKNFDYKIISFFILPPSRTVLKERLSNRDMKDKLIVDERMKQFNKDVLHWEEYDYVVINDKLNNCFNNILHLLEAESGNVKNDYDKNLIKKHVETLI